MSIPDYQTLMLPLLQCTTDGGEHSFPSLVESLASKFKLTDPERHELLPSGGQFIFDNRVGWARTYMKKAGLLSTPKRGYIQIMERRRTVLGDQPKRNDNTLLRQFPDFLEFHGAKGADGKHEPEAAVAESFM